MNAREVPALSRFSLVDDDLLQAVREEVSAFGFRRATATSIAERAGISRVTLFRRGGGIKQLLLDSITTQIVQLVDQASAESTGDTGLERFISRSLLIMRNLSQDELVRAIIEHNPEMAIPYITTRFGSSQLAAMTALVPLIEEGINDGSITVRDAERAAKMAVLIVGPFVINTDIVATFLDEDELNSEVRRLLVGYLTQPLDADLPPSRQNPSLD